MKILVVGPKAPHTMESLVASAAMTMGHTVLHFEDRGHSRISNPYVRKAKYLLSQLHFGLGSRRTEIFLRAIKEFNPELVLVISASRMLPQLISRAKQLSKAKFVVWYPDPFGNFFNTPIVACDYDHIFVKCHTIVERLSALGKNVSYLPEACAPDFDKRVPPDPIYECDISTAGSYYSYRIQLIEVLANYNLCLYGISKDKYREGGLLDKSLKNRDIYLGERAKLFSSSRLVINTLNPSEANSMNVRLFEAACSGTPVITEYRPALEDLFVVGKEVIAFSTRDELKEKVEYYLSHPQEAAAIGERGACRALRDHTYTRRISEILTTVIE